MLQVQEGKGIMSIYSVLLVEDEIGTRQAMSDKILSHPQLCLYAAVGSCKEALACMQGVPDILVTDLGLPDGNGISLVQKARSLSIETMVITVFGDESNVIASIEAGASSYLLKDHGFNNLADSICAMMQGESTIDSRVARFLLARLSEHNPSKQSQTFTESPQPTQQDEKSVIKPAQDNTLSKREIEVLELVSKGLTYAETGGVLNISENTIRAHIRNIYTKLTVNSRFEAVYEATVMGLIEPASKPVTSKEGQRT